MSNMELTPESSREDHEIVGMVESVEDEKQTPFTSPQELWEILAEKNSDKKGNNNCRPP